VCSSAQAKPAMCYLRSALSLARWKSAVLTSPVKESRKYCTVLRYTYCNIHTDLFDFLTCDIVDSVQPGAYLVFPLGVPPF